MRYAKKAMIVAPQPEPTEAGADVLREGGNAVDAGIACALVQGVVDPLMCGIAGFGSCGIYMPAKKFHGYIDAHAPAPLGARPDMWANLIESEARDGYGFILRGRLNDIGYKSICAPANLKMYYEAHKEHGSLPWSRIVEPAIAWAESGWTVRPHVHYWWSDEGAFGRAPNHERTGFTERRPRALLPARRHAQARGRPRRQSRLRPDPARHRQGRRRRLLFGRNRRCDRRGHEEERGAALDRRSQGMEAGQKSAAVGRLSRLQGLDQPAARRRRDAARDAEHPGEFRSPRPRAQFDGICPHRQRGDEARHHRQGRPCRRSEVRRGAGRAADLEVLRQDHGGRDPCAA